MPIRANDSSDSGREHPPRDISSETRHCYSGIAMKPLIVFDFVPPQRDEVKCNQ
eukprot:gene26781-biopygen17336